MGEAVASNPDYADPAPLLQDRPIQTSQEDVRMTALLGK
jgi:hypothetical protein